MVKMITKFADAWKKYGTKHDWGYFRKVPVLVKAIQMDKNFTVKTRNIILKGNAGDFLVLYDNYDLFIYSKSEFYNIFKKEGVKHD